MNPSLFIVATMADASFGTAWPIYGLAILIGYALGSIPFGYFVGRQYGIDIRQHGSGNIGATNVVRVLGKKPGYTVFFCDLLKGVLAVRIVLPIAEALISRAVVHAADVQCIINVTPIDAPQQYAAYIQGAAVPAGIVAAVACILGHDFPVWLRFRGGKGVATTVGVLLGLMPVSLLISAVVWVAVFYSLRYVSLASLLAALVLPASVWYFKVRPAGGGSWPLFYFAVFAAALIFWRHRSNIRRLLNGTEARFVPSPDPAQPLP